MTASSPVSHHEGKILVGLQGVQDLHTPRIPWKCLVVDIRERREGAGEGLVAAALATSKIQRRGCRRLADSRLR
jgi:hypothetical protein